MPFDESSSHRRKRTWKTMSASERRAAIKERLRFPNSFPWRKGWPPEKDPLRKAATPR